MHRSTSFANALFDAVPMIVTTSILSFSVALLASSNQSLSIEITIQPSHVRLQASVSDDRSQQSSCDSVF
jgi:hypothetical protein